MVPVLLYLQLSLSRGSLNNSNLLVSTIENSPPWNLNGVGICIDLLHRVQQLAQEDDIYFDYQLRPWTRTYSAAVQDVINISTNTALLAADISITALRISSGAVYSMPFNDDGVLIVKSALKPQTGYTTLQQIQDATKKGAGTWRVCIQGGTAQAEQFRAKYPGVVWKFVVHQPGAYDALKNNECELAVLPTVQTNYDLATVEKSGELATLGAQPLTLGLAWTASNPSIANFISQYLATLQSSGELDIIKAKYFDPKSLDSNTVDKPLLGQHYYVVVLPDEPYIQLDKTGLVWPKKVGYVQPQPANLTSRFSGFIIDVLEDLSVKLGFQYTLRLPTNAYDGFDGSYGQAVRDVESLGVKGNFYAGPLFITPARITNLYLTSPVQNTGLNLLRVRTKFFSESNAFSVPFSSELWMLILLVLVASGVTFWYLESDEGNHNEDIIGEYGRSARGLAENFVQTTYLSMVTVTTFACHTPSTVGGKVFSFFYLLFCTLILTSYTANLTTIMVGLAKNEKIEEVKTFVRGGNIACIQSDTAYGKHLKETYSKFGLKFVEKETKEEMLMDLKDGKCNGLINSEWMVVHQNNEDCAGLTRGLDAVWRQSFAFGATKDVRGEEVIRFMSREIAKMQSDETMSQSTYLWFNPDKCALAKKEDNADVSKLTMGVEHVRLPLQMFGIVCVFVWIVERMANVRNKELAEKALLASGCIAGTHDNRYPPTVAPEETPQSLDFVKFWQCIDSDCDGKSRRWKLKLYLGKSFRLLGFDLSGRELGRLLTKLDVDSSGLITKEELFGAFHVEGDGEGSVVTKEQIINIFNEMGIDQKRKGNMLSRTVNAVEDSMAHKLTKATLNKTTGVKLRSVSEPEPAKRDAAQNTSTATNAVMHYEIPVSE